MHALKERVVVMLYLCPVDVTIHAGNGFLVRDPLTLAGLYITAKEPD